MTQNTKVKFTDEQLEKLRKHKEELKLSGLTETLVELVTHSTSKKIPPSTSSTKGRKAVCMRLDPEWMDAVRDWYGMPFQQVVASVLDHL